MTLLALILVLTAAFVHAIWNFLIKRTGGGPIFLWLFGALAAIIYAPFGVAAFLFQLPRIRIIEFVFIFGSSILHLVYFILLSYSYRIADLSLVYPLARGTGVMLSTVSAILFLSERPTLIGLVGAILISISVFVLIIGDPHNFWKSRNRRGLVCAILTGTAIASYTLWDKYAVSKLLIPPLLMEWSINLFRTAILSAFVVYRWDDVRTEWRTHRREILGVALLSPLSYILILTALVFSPVSYVAPAREISTLIGALMGTRLLAEGDAPRRLVAASIMVLGVIALTLN